MRRPRTIYYNDARHTYLFVFEPPMTLGDACRPIDEVAGTAVDTFAYGVERGDGLFYPSKVGQRFGEDMETFKQAAYWRVWNNMQSLIDRGLDPLTVLINRAHKNGMEFFASMRLGSYGGMDPTQVSSSGGRGFMHDDVRDHIFTVLEELATQYPVDGVELDFAAAPAGCAYCFRSEDAKEGMPVMTDWVRKVSSMVRNRSGKSGLVGARVFPTEAGNLAAGQDVRTWIREKLIDYVVPMVYAYPIVDSNMPIEWLVDAADDANCSVCPMINAHYHTDKRRFHTSEAATPAMMRAAAANYWDRGADGMYTTGLRWPLGDAERSILTELGDRDLVQEQCKHYVVSRRDQYADEVQYTSPPLPIEISSSDTGTRHRIPFHVADDFVGAADHVRQVLLRMNVRDLVSADQLSIQLNGQSLSTEACVRHFSGQLAPYTGQWLEFHLKQVVPQRGQNVLEIALDRRAEGLMSSLEIEDVEVLVEYGSYPSRLRQA